MCFLLVAGCGKDTQDRAADEGYRLPPVPPASDFVGTVDHPYYPLDPGSSWVYRAETADGVETIRVSVLPQTRVVDGITATVVRDQAFVDDELIEDTYDWYAQDRDGNVWYLGEDTTAYQPGKEPDKTGSWEAGQDGARPGLVMPAVPEVGDRYQQEYRAGVAEDRGEILALDAAGEVPWGRFEGAVRTRDTTPLEPDLVEYKYYAEGVGTVLEEEEDDRLELISFTPG